MKINPLFAIDFYKAGHIFQYPPGTEIVYSNFTPRSNKRFNYEGKQNYIVFQGLQLFIQHFLIDTWNENFFKQPKDQVVAIYKAMMDECLGGLASVDHIAALHDLGYLPIAIRALKEGSKVPIGVPVYFIYNTHPDFAWLTNYIETVASAETWKASTAATIAHHYRMILDRYADETGVDRAAVDFQGHDFSLRGIGGLYDGASTGIGHLSSFLGTDNVLSIDAVRRYYFEAGRQGFIAGSIPATEHSVMCAGGQDDEYETFRRIIQDVYPSGLVSVVSDTWDFWNVLTNTAKQLKPIIMKRKPDALGNAKVVFRPDSGDPVRIICGDEIREVNENLDFESFKDWAAEMIADRVRDETDHGEHGPTEEEEVLKFQGKYYKVVVEFFWNRHDKTYYYMDGTTILSVEEVELSPEEKGSVEVLWEIFGGTVNEAGYKVLCDKVGLIYGDSITLDRAEEILKRLKAKGYASSNVVFGIGSYTYQYVTRDTFGWAVKATWVQINGEGRNIQKDPKTDNGEKKSLTGRIRVVKDENGVLKALQQQPFLGDDETDEVFLDGKLLRHQVLDDIRAVLKAS